MTDRTPRPRPTRGPDRARRPGAAPRTRRFAAGAAAGVLLAGTVWMAAAPTASATANISVVQVIDAEQPQDCVFAAQAMTSGALSRTFTDTTDSWTMTVTATKRLCDPIKASAVIYAMPSATKMWPQTLSELEKFTVGAVGVTTITFTKGCEPVQFDVVTGATPEEIDLGGMYHGPFLFPYEFNGLQHFGKAGCEPPPPPPPPDESTTTASTTPTIQGSTTTTTKPVVTTPPAAVAAATTTTTAAPKGSATSTGAPAATVQSSTSSAVPISIAG